MRSNWMRMVLEVLRVAGCRLQVAGMRESSARVMAVER